MCSTISSSVKNLSFKHGFHSVRTDDSSVDATLLSREHRVRKRLALYHITLCVPSLQTLTLMSARTSELNSGNFDYVHCGSRGKNEWLPTFGRYTEHESMSVNPRSP